MSESPRSAQARLQASVKAVANRIAGVPAWVLLTQLFIGFGWLRAATEKAIDPSWWSGAVLRTFLVDHDAVTLGWYAPFADIVVAPRATGIAAIVLLLQFAAGTSLVTGRFVAAGLAIGVFLNLNFLATGAVDPSAFYLLSQGGIALWLIERRMPDRHTRQILSAAAVTAITLGLISIPFISTLHPAGVIADPAVMMVFGGTLTVLGCEMAYHRITRSQSARPRQSTQ